MSEASPACRRGATCRPGRLTFLHRSWGPLEPFDNSFPELLRKRGVYSHLVTDHFHYWEDGGAHLPQSLRQLRVRPRSGRRSVEGHGRSRTGSGCARCITSASSHSARRKYLPQNVVNREFIREEKDFPSVQCFAHGFDFLDRNRGADNWLLQIETFDPHEPFTLRHASRSRSRPAGTGRCATGRATVASTNCRRNARNCVRTTTRSCRSATSCSASSSTISTRTTSGRTRRSSSPPITGSCSANTTSGRRTG